MSVIKQKNVPQANSLNKVCDLLALVEAGIDTPDDLGSQLGLVHREIEYYRQAARILGLAEIANGKLSICERGHRLLKARTPTEKNEVLREGVWESDVFFQVLVSFGRRTPTKEQLTALLIEHTGLGKTTAARRAHTLLAWLKTIDRES
jgi:hypothetical protein